VTPVILVILTFLNCNEEQTAISKPTCFQLSAFCQNTFAMAFSHYIKHGTVAQDPNQDQGNWTIGQLDNWTIRSHSTTPSDYTPSI